ncbi:MAG: beta-lactamase family protein [Actinobacteria bacterium]|nr:beta-lactamase family protein [Actinomycetota bacterium]
MPEVSGFVADGFEPVRAAFEANFRDHGDLGAGVCVYRDGAPVVDLVGGVTAHGSDDLYSADHLQMVFSTTKGAAAICAHLLAERGQLHLDAPVASHWPEFAANGKADIPVSWLLCHKSGLVDVDRPLTLDDALDWDRVTAALAAAPPIWEPGTQHGYHAVTYGWLVGEIVRRVSGRTLGRFFADEIAGPLGLEFWIGLPDEQIPRVVDLVPPGPPPGVHFGSPDDPQPGMIEMLQLLMGPDSLIARALTAPGGAFASETVWNEPAVWQAEIPAANGITNAGSLARMYAATVGEVDGVRLLSPATVARAIEPQTEGADAVLIFEIPFGLGFMRDAPFAKFGSPTAFGHYGAGGSVGFADHEAGIGFGYVMNKMDLGIAGDPRTSALIDALYGCL